MSKTSFGDSCKRRRRELGLSQVGLSDIIALSQTLVSRIENGQEPEMPTLKKIARALESRIIIHPGGAVTLEPDSQLSEELKKGMPTSTFIDNNRTQPSEHRLQRAIKTVLDTNGIGETVRAVNEVTKRAALELFTNAHGVKRSRSHACASRLIGKQCLLGRTAERCPMCEPPGDDHGEIFNRNGMAEFYVFHPYHFSGETARELQDWCDTYGLQYGIWPLDWYFLGRTTAVIIQRKSSARTTGEGPRVTVGRRERPNCRRKINRLLQERGCTLEELIESGRLGGALPIQARKMIDEQNH
jgi:transcriptional regulator with XRE-family HTH domain